MKKPEPKYPNSAGRLLAILESLQKGQPISQQLTTIMFGAEPAKNEKDLSIEGIEAINELHVLYATFLRDLANAEMANDERAVLEKGLSSLQNLMYPMALNQATRLVSDAEKSLLEVCATRLLKENIISEDDISNIRESISSLRETIEELSSDSILRSVLLELARLSEDSVNRFNIYGAKGLKHAFKEMLSEVAEIYLQDEEDISDIKDSPAWKKAVKHLKLFDSIAAKTMEYRPLLEKASQFLLGG